MQNKLTAALMIGLLAFTAACNQNSGSGKKIKLKSGIEYQLVTDAGARKAKHGDYVTVHVTQRNHKDSVVGSSYQRENKPIVVRIDTAMFKNKVQEVFNFMGAGDSLLIWEESDSIFKGGPYDQRPPFIPKGTKIAYGIKVVKVESPTEMWDNYKKDHKLTNTVKTASGLEYQITQQGTGPLAASGDSVLVGYQGKFFDDKEFDASKPGAPYGLLVDRGRVIKGWDEFLMTVPEGTKATLMIPYDLAYGAQGYPGGIPPFTPLVFEMDLVKVFPKGAGAAPKGAEPKAAVEDHKGHKH
ncbi:MAG: FKBP-type peptidyl-prolyl cis-trans isomerase [Bacteroidota bacterium]